MVVQTTVSNGLSFKSFVIRLSVYRGRCNSFSRAGREVMAPRLLPRGYESESDTRPIYTSKHLLT